MTTTAAPAPVQLSAPAAGHAGTLGATSAGQAATPGTTSASHTGTVGTTSASHAGTLGAPSARRAGTLGRINSAGRAGTLFKITVTTALTPMVWGSTYLVTTELLPPGRPLLDAVIRALPAGLLVLAVTRQLPTGRWWWRAAVLGALNIGVFFALLFVAAYRLPGGVAATLGAVQPLLVAGLAFGLLGERPTRWRLGWGVAGVAAFSRRDW